jgi:hypothetical protein
MTDTSHAVLALLVAAWPAASSATDAGERAQPRYRIESAQAVRSADPAARFAIEARATRAPASDAGRRFTVVASPKATGGICGPDPDALFANGFE